MFEQQRTQDRQEANYQLKFGEPLELHGEYALITISAEDTGPAICVYRIDGSTVGTIGFDCQTRNWEFQLSEEVLAAHEVDTTYRAPDFSDNPGITIQAQNFRMWVRQFSNKGPLFVIERNEGEELGRTWIDLQLDNRRTGPQPRYWKGDPADQ